MSQLAPKLMQDMIDEEVDRKINRYQTVTNSMASGKSLEEKGIDLEHSLYKGALSETLKNMQARYLMDVSKNCYRSRWMQEEFTNYEQINLCREQKRIKYFGAFETRYENLRDSNRFIYQDCVAKAGNDLVEGTLCARGYVQGIERDNARLAAEFNS